MKKRILAVTLLTMALGLSACSSNKPAETATTAETTTAAQTTQAAVTDTETESGEEAEESYVEGTITKIDGDIVTIKNNEDDKEQSYDLSEAEINSDYELSVGDEVEVVFAEGASGDIIPALALDVYTSVIEENTDPSVTGTIEKAENDRLELKSEDGETYQLSTANSYIVSKGGLVSGVNAKITYLGDLDDTDPIPMAIKIVTEDSYDSKEASMNAFRGTVSKIDGNNFVAETKDGNYFSCSAEDSVDLSSIDEGDDVLISYTGPLTAKIIAVTGIEK